MTDVLADEQKFYDARKDEFKRKYLGKQILIYKGKEQGAFDNFTDAFNFAKDNKFTPGKFMIKPVTEEDEALQVVSVAYQ